jgi:putative hydrolase of the HAD superfamily
VRSATTTTTTTTTTRAASLLGVFFDLDNTLIDRQTACDGYFIELRRRFPDALAAPDALDALHRIDDAGLTDRRIFCAEVVRRFPALGMSAAAFWEDFADGLVAATVPCAPAMIAELRACAARFKLAVVTNGSGTRQRAKLARAGLASLFTDEQLVISAEVGAAKPDPRIFQLALQRAGLAADRVLFVGDDPVRDIGGARAAGLRTCWVDHGRSFPASVPPPDLVVRGLEELLAHLAHDGGGR